MPVRKPDNSDLRLEVISALGRIVRERRKKRLYSQEEFAAVTGVDRAYISNVERGVRNLSITTSLLKIAEGLNVTGSSLLREAEKLSASSQRSRPSSYVKHRKSARAKFRPPLNSATSKLVSRETTVFARSKAALHRMWCYLLTCIVGSELVIFGSTAHRCVGYCCVLEHKGPCSQAD